MPCRPLPSLLCLTILASPLAAADKTGPADTNAQPVRQAVERSLPWLEKEGLAWLDKRKCIACHHGAFMIWSHQEARLRGIKVDAKKIDDWTSRSLGMYLANQKEMEKKKNGGVEANFLLMSQGVMPAKDDKTAQSFHDVAAVLVNAQKESGFWKYEGQGQKRPEAEADEATTLWAILALTGMEKKDSPRLKNRELARAWLKKQPTGDGTEPIALRLLLEHQFGNDRDRVQILVKELLSRQNADGSWSWGKGWPSDPYATGQALYALARTGMSADDSAIQKARKFLVDKQRPDGSWYSPTKKPTGIDNAIAVYWGSAWATIGLARSLNGEN